MHRLNATIDFQYDNMGNSYLAATLDSHFLQPWLMMLQRQLSPYDYFFMTHQQRERDHGTYHMTVIRPTELPQVNMQVGAFVGYPLEIIIYGIGSIREMENTVYFLVCDCYEADRLRCNLSLEKQDFHITLGFQQQDIFDQPKNKYTLIPPFSIIENTSH